MRTLPLYPHLRNPLGYGRRNPDMVLEYDAEADVLWSHFTTSTYKSGDLIALATREALQNGVDAINAASRRGQIKRGEGNFSVTYEVTDYGNDTGWVSWEDNGVGMDFSILKKFLSLGASGKRTEEQSDAQLSMEVKRYTRPPGDKRGTYVFRLNGLWQFTTGAKYGKLDKDYVFDYKTTGNVGGFGVAKAVILGVSPDLDWEIHTRNLYAKGAAMGEQMRVEEISTRRGTKLTVRGIDLSSRFDYEVGEWMDIHERLKRVLAFNSLPHINLYLNGETITPYFSGKRGSVVPHYGNWGDSAVPGTTGYPFQSSRDGLTPRVEQSFLTFAQDVEKDETPVRSVEDEIYDPGVHQDLTWKQREQRDSLEEEMAKALETPEIQAGLNRAGTAVQAYAKAQQKGWRGEDKREAESASPGIKPRAVEKTIQDRIVDTGATELTEIVLVPVEEVAEKLLDALDKQDRVAGSQSGVEIVTGDVRATLEKVRDTGEIGSEDVANLGEVLEKVGEQAVELGGGGIAQIASVQTAVTDIIEKAEAENSYTETVIQSSKTDQRFNPFGTMAGLWISKNGFLNANGKYDSGRASRFKKGYTKWLPYLMLWDSTLRLLANRTGIRNAFKPGFVLDNGLLGLYTKLESGTRVVYINPFRFKDAAKVYKNDPLALAVFVVNVAVHELAHMQTGTKHTDPEGSHGQEWAIEREDMGTLAGPFLPVIALLAEQYLGLTPPVPAGVKATEKVMKDKIRKLNAAHKKEVKKLKRLAEKLEAQQQAACPRCYKELIEALDSGGHFDTLAWLKTKGG